LKSILYCIQNQNFQSERFSADDFNCKVYINMRKRGGVSYNHTKQAIDLGMIVPMFGYIIFLIIIKELKKNGRPEIRVCSLICYSEGECMAKSINAVWPKVSTQVRSCSTSSYLPYQFQPL
jgi:hypothetical protein